MYHLVHRLVQQLVQSLLMTQLKLESSISQKRNGIIFTALFLKNIRSETLINIAPEFRPAYWRKFKTALALHQIEIGYLEPSKKSRH